MTPKPEHGSFHPADRKEWHEWLSKNHASSEGVLLTIHKKNSQNEGLLLPDAIDEALCFGWIDSKLSPQDQASYRLLFTPRKPGSIWSARNKQCVEELIREGKMTAAEIAKVVAAKKDGSWDILNDVEELRIPEDFRLSLAGNVEAQKNFVVLSDSAKKQVLWWIQSAKRSETRMKRIQLVVEELQKGAKNPFG
jgi:uncharacterized protein YdeI (YjbR/CyaY-like superfamily)